MPAPREPVSGVDEVLRARANARRIKEHYEGTLGVPSELQSLSHLLAHDKDGVFAGLENLPFYNKSDITAPPQPAPEAPPPPQPVRRRTHGLPSSGAMPSCIPLPASPAAAAMGRPAPLDVHPWATPDLSSPSGFQPPGSTGAGDHQHPDPQQVPLPPIPPADEQYPPDPGAGPASPGRLRLPTGLTVDPWRWTPSDDYGQVMEGAPETSGSQQQQQQQSQQHQHPPHPRSTRSRASPEGTWDADPRVAALQRPDSRISTVASASSSRQASPTGRAMSGAYGLIGRQSTGAGSSVGTPLGESGFGSGAFEAETEEERKYRMAKQRLLSAHDLSPQEWARIGPPQDAADLEKFVARGYSVSVDFDRQTLMPKRVARPDIFHISAEEAQRRQMESDEATLALQAMRRAEMEAEEAAAEQARLARAAARGPRYDAMGVVQVDRSASPVQARFLDWHPDGVAVLQQQQQQQQQAGDSKATHAGRRSLSGGSGSVGGNMTAASALLMSPRGHPRCASASRSRPESAALYGRCSLGGRAVSARRTSLQEQQLSQTRQTDTAITSDPYVYEDLGDDAAADNELGLGAAYGTRPPRRRHHSAMAVTFTPPQRPPGVSDAHYAQMVRQQRKWLNGPVQPPRPVSAAPFPAPTQYVRPRSSRPPPEGTAAPIPSRIAAEAAAVAAAAEAANRATAALRTIIRQRSKLLPPRGPQDQGRASWAAVSSSRPGSASQSTAGFHAPATSAANPWTPAATLPPRDPLARQDSGGAAVAPPSRPMSASQAPPPQSEPPQLAGAGTSGSVQLTYGATPNGKRQPWEYREHVAAAAAVGIIPPRLSMDAADAAPPSVDGTAARRSTSNTSASGRSRAGGSSTSARRQQQQQNGQRKSAVFGETLPPDSSGKEGAEQYLPRKFELREGIVLDGYMGR